MERVNTIFKNHKYQEYIDRIKQAEENRIFCLHNMSHFLDVARIAALINEEERLGISKELIYATALLHDIGRYVQYADGTPHELASARLAPEILQEVGFEPQEQEEILYAIREHRNAEIAKEKSLAGIIYRADKASRACFACVVQDLCDWKAEKKNLEIRY
ncbi:MAG: HD domain-containing protein [Lachnospiraceae bacterium]|nr:HD domain-containing protein [Lachnospiraceae bacterium]